jgi:hypothetical protein
VTSGPQLTVEGLISQGASFEDIEEYIETLALPSEQLGALWLLAWAEATDAATRRRVVADLLFEPRDRPDGARTATAPGASEQSPCASARSRFEGPRSVFPTHHRAGSKRSGWQRRG